MKTSTLIIRITGLLLSLLVHAVLLYFVFNIQFKIEIFPLGRTENVFIAEEGIMAPPEDVQSYLDKLESAETQGRRAAEDGSGEPSTEFVLLKQDISLQSSRSLSQDISKASTDLSAGFYLELPIQDDLLLPENYAFSLSDPVQEDTASDPSFQRQMLLKELADLRSYYPDIVKVLPGAEEKNAALKDSGRLSPVLAVDLRPWADQVVVKIQEVWFVPVAEDQGTQGQVRISAIITKEGHITSSEITESSGVEGIDRSVVEALEAGSPFPVLPDTFPAGEITVIFEFYYGY